MSLAGAVESLRASVTSVTSPQNQTLPTEAVPAVEVTSVTSKKTKSQREAVASEGRENSGQGEISPNGEVSNSSFLRYQRYQGTALTEPDLAALITTEAHRAKLCPADLWAFLSLEDLAAVATGDLDELMALRAFAESRSRTGDRTRGGHTLPFPGPVEAKASKPVCCGDCAHFERDRIGDGSGIGRCQAGMDDNSVPRYPGVLRLCREFLDRANRERAEVGTEAG